LQINGATMPTTISGVTSGDTIDLTGIRLRPERYGIRRRRCVEVTSGSTVLAQLNVANLIVPGGTRLALVPDGQSPSGTDIVEQAACYGQTSMTPSCAATLDAGAGWVRRGQSRVPAK